MYALTVLAIPCLFAQGPAAANEALWAQARAHFEQGIEQRRSVAASRRLFAEAAGDLAQLRQAGSRNPALYLSLGNAEALAGHWPQAIWAYHCGLQLDPNDATLRAHLEYARRLVSYPPGDRGQPPAATWPNWLHRPTANERLIFAATAYGLAWLAGGWWYIGRRTTVLIAALAFSGIALLAGAAYVAAIEHAHADRDCPLVIVAADTMLHRGNGSSYPLHPDVPRLPPGLEAHRLHQRGAWMQVQLRTGEVGWVPAERVLVVLP